MKAVFIASLLLVVVQAFPLNKRGRGVDIRVNSSSDFCSYLPPSPGQSVSATENDASPFCTKATENAAAFPIGFIQSAHFLSTPTYVQVTGRINHTVYDILVEDGGGQYDNKNLPEGTCNGLKHWVNLIEPDSEQFCIRCCQIKSECNIGISTRGCLRIVPGDYSYNKAPTNITHPPPVHAPAPIPAPAPAPIEEPAQEPAEEPAQEPAQEPVQEPDHEHAPESNQEPTQEPIPEPVLVPAPHPHHPPAHSHTRIH